MDKRKFLYVRREAGIRFHNFEKWYLTNINVDGSVVMLLTIAHSSCVDNTSENQSKVVGILLPDFNYALYIISSVLLLSN